MSSFKKLRLDPELPASLRAQPGANDSGGRGFLDGSSFSSSTSGGSGAYGRSSGPFRTRYSQPLGAPSPSGSSFSRFAPYYFGKDRRTSLRVPLIRARRDDSDSEGQRPSSRASLNSSIGGDSTVSATSSTAQRIIETLQNLSTPVMNAGKIRIDQDIKAVQPLPFGGVSPLSRSSPGGALNRSTGPPKMCSSLLLSNPSPANQTSPMFNPGDHRRLLCIPRMVDAATNTDKEEVSSPSQAIFSSKTVTPPATAKSQFSGSSIMKPVESTTSKEDNSEEEFHECSSDFTFSNAWPRHVFDRYLASGKEEKSANKGPVGGQQRIINGYSKDAATASSLGAPQFSSKGISSFSGSSPSFSLSSAAKLSPTPSISGSGSTGGMSVVSSPLKESPFGKSPLNKSFDSKADASKPFGSETNKVGSGFTGFSFGKSASSPLKTAEPPKPFTFGNPVTTNEAKTTVSLPIDKVDAPKTDSPAPVKSSFGGSSSSAASNSTLPPLSLLNKSSPSKWRCSTCMVENDVSAGVCVCCGEKNPTPVAPKLASSTEKKWKCPTCMVENNPTVAKCVCCSEKNPNPSSASPPSSSTLSKKWRCPTCMIENDQTVAKCVCCSEKNPNPASKTDSLPAAETAPAPTFKFGISSSNAPATSGSFVFGAPAQSDNIQKPPASSFQFGLPSTTSSLTPISSPTAVSSSTLTTSSTPSTTSTFKFGTQSPAPPATFGFNASASTTSPATIAVNTPTTTSNTMFSAPKIPESTSSTGCVGLFGTSSSIQTSQSTPSNNSFKFGSTPTSTTNDVPKSSAPTTFSFGASATTKPAFNNTFSFGDRPQNPTSGLSGATPSIMTPAPAPAPTPPPALGGTPNNFSFGASNPAPSPFGQLQPASNNPTPASGGLFTFGGGGSTNPPPTSLTPSFSLTPNLNFGSTPGSSIPFGNPTLPTPNAGSQPPPTLFQFNSTPSDSPGGRKIKKAVRRFNK